MGRGRKTISPEQAEFNRYMGAKLKHFRLSAGMKRYTLSKKLSLTPIMIQRYEDGLYQIPLATLVLICKVLGNCSVVDFIPNSENKPLTEES